MVKLLSSARVREGRLSPSALRETDETDAKHLLRKVHVLLTRVEEIVQAQEQEQVLVKQARLQQRALSPAAFFLTSGSKEQEDRT
jgi:hypothetical protein